MGAGVGIAVGVGIGTSVGAGIGTAVGAGSGTDVGAGADAGEFMGEIVGAELGAKNTSWSKTSHSQSLVSVPELLDQSVLPDVTLDLRTSV